MCTVSKTSKFVLIVIAIAFTKNAFAQSKPPACKKELDSLLHKDVYLKVDSFPEPKIGMQKLFANIGRGVKVSVDTTNSWFGGRVIVGFVVKPDGSVTGGRLIKDESGSYQIGRQMLQIIAKTQWQPGYCNNKRVPVLLRIPLMMDLQGL